MAKASVTKESIGDVVEEAQITAGQVLALSDMLFMFFVHSGNSQELSKNTLANYIELIMAKSSEIIERLDAIAKLDRLAKVDFAEAK